jgi:glycosyltransferase involved in cell wall biosynthesis
MKVAIIGTVGLPANYGGYETLVENLVERRNNQDIEYVVYCSSPSYKEKSEEYKGAKLKYIGFKANGWQAILYDGISMVKACRTCDVVLSLGTIGCVLLPIIRLFRKKKVVVNMDGLDDKRSKWGLIQRTVIGFARLMAAKNADVLIADNAAIQKFIKEKYRKDSALIEYGGDNACKVEDDALLLELYSLRPREYCFKVARIEPENNIEMILNCFEICSEHKLVLVGNWHKSDYGRTLKEKFSDRPNIVLLDAIYDSKRLNLLRSNCRLYIHGHSMGGTNPSLVEAMSLSLPIAACDVIYNRETTEGKALYFSDAESLACIIKELDDTTCREVSENMFEVANRRYKWSVITDKYEKLILSLL